MLRVINDDHVAAGKGFGTHPHRDMEIITYVLQGRVEHRDSLGTRSVIPAGDVQRMTAGTGIQHSEFNPSPSEDLHFLQIWILPEARGIKPGYEQKTLGERTQGKLTLVASHEGGDGALKINQDADLYIGALKSGQSVEQGNRGGPQCIRACGARQGQHQWYCARRRRRREDQRGAQAELFCIR